MERDQTAKAQLRLRLPEPLRAALEGAAANRGVSLNTEAVDRLERSFEQEWFHGLLGGPEVATITQIVGRIFNEVGIVAGFTAARTTGAAWLRNAYAYDQAVKGVVAALESLRPPGDAAAPSVTLPGDEDMAARINFASQHLGEGLARTTMEVIRGSGVRAEHDWERDARVKLGSLLSEGEAK